MDCCGILNKFFEVSLTVLKRVYSFNICSYIEYMCDYDFYKKLDQRIFSHKHEGLELEKVHLTHFYLLSGEVAPD